MAKTKIGIGVIVLAVIALAIVASGLLTIVNPTIDFAGFTWQDTGTMYSGSGGAPPESVSSCQSGGVETNAVREGEFLRMDLKAGTAGFRIISTDVTGVDELLIIYEGYGTVSCSNGQSNTGMGMGASVKGSVSGSVGDGVGVSTSRCPSGGDSATKTFQPAIWKLKNNFDGTWSSMTSIGVGDIFIVKNTQPITGDKQTLNIELGGGNSCGNGGYAQGSLKLYNIVRKENAFALCKADKYAYDANGDGRIATDGSECVDLRTIVLNSEEAIKESYDEKLARITAELTAKNAGLTADIEALKLQLTGTISQQQITALQQQIISLESQLTTASDKTTIQAQIDMLRQQQLDSNNLNDRLAALEAELKEAKITLDAVQAGDKSIINVVIAQEQFKKPSFIERWFNSIIAFFKNLF